MRSRVIRVRATYHFNFKCSQLRTYACVCSKCAPHVFWAADLAKKAVTYEYESGFDRMAPCENAGAWKTVLKRARAEVRTRDILLAGRAQ